jgi:hypothetical protein
MFIKFSRVTIGALSVIGTSAFASAQGLNPLGTRATAMGAFVAVADDASAVAWNPAGLVSGPIFNLQIDLGRSSRHPSQPLAVAPTAGESATTLVSLGTTPVGLAYYRISTTSFTVSSPAVGVAPDRQNRHVHVQTLVTSHLGATVQQSVGDYLTLGATVKLVRGNVGRVAFSAASWDEAFERAEHVDREGSTRGDVDLGAMVAVGRVKAGVTVRNLTAPTFGDEDRGVTASLDRHARLGVAWGDRWPGLSRMVFAVDADLTAVADSGGDRRDLAAGGEWWVRNRRVGIRGGVRASTLGDARVVVNAGGSFAVRSGTYVDAFVGRGAADELGWGLAVRLTY